MFETKPFFFLIRQLQLITVAWGQPLGFLNFVPCETSLHGFFPLLNVSKEWRFLYYKNISLLNYPELIMRIPTWFYSSFLVFYLQVFFFPFTLRLVNNYLIFDYSYQPKVNRLMNPRVSQVLLTLNSSIMAMYCEPEMTESAADNLKKWLKNIVYISLCSQNSCA